MEKDFLTIQDVARQLQIHVRTIPRMIQRGDLPPLSFGDGRKKTKGWYRTVLERFYSSENIRNAG